jgi:hypothetical protein
VTDGRGGGFRWRRLSYSYYVMRCSTNFMTSKLTSWPSVTPPSTSQITKLRSWNIFEQHHEFLKNMRLVEPMRETIKSAETFVCRIYNMHRRDSVDGACNLLFDVSRWHRCHWLNKWCALFPFDQSTLLHVSDDMEKRPLQPDIWITCAICNGMKNWGMAAARNGGLKSVPHMHRDGSYLCMST